MDELGDEGRESFMRTVNSSRRETGRIIRTIFHSARRTLRTSFSSSERSFGNVLRSASGRILRRTLGRLKGGEGGGGSDVADAAREAVEEVKSGRG